MLFHRPLPAPLLGNRVVLLRIVIVWERESLATMREEIVSIGTIAAKSRPWVIALAFGLLIGLATSSRVEAAPGPPDGLDVSEMNVDADGNIAVHEQGVADVNVTNGSLTAEVAFPASQTVDGTVTATQGGDWTVAGNVTAAQSGDWTVGISGTPTVNVANLPSSNSLAGDSVRTTIELGGVGNPASVSLFVAADEVLTDLIASSSSRCTTTLLGAGGEVIFTRGNQVSLSLNSGMQGPLQILLRPSGSAGDSCLAEAFWTGYSAS